MPIRTPLAEEVTTKTIRDGNKRTIITETKTTGIDENGEKIVEVLTETRTEPIEPDDPDYEKQTAATSSSSDDEPDGKELTEESVLTDYAKITNLESCPAKKMNDVEIPPNAPRPRLCVLRKWADFNGYGFNLHAEKGQVGQFIGKVDEESPAFYAGMRYGDRIIEVNDVNIGEERHKQVVERVRGCKDQVSMLVVDPDTDKYYQDLGINVHHSMPNVERHETPVPRPGQPQTNSDENIVAAVVALDVKDEITTKEETVVETEKIVVVEPEEPVVVEPEERVVVEPEEPVVVETETIVVETTTVAEAVPIVDDDNERTEVVDNVIVTAATVTETERVVDSNDDDVVETTVTTVTTTTTTMTVVADEDDGIDELSS